MPLDTISESLEESYKLKVTDTTILSILDTAKTLLEPLYHQTKQQTITADVLGLDETCPIDGKTGYI